MSVGRVSVIRAMGVIGAMTGTVARTMVVFCDRIIKWMRNRAHEFSLKS